MKKLYLLLVLSAILFSKSNKYDLDKAHILASNWIMNKSDFLDRYLANKHDTKHLSNTKLNIAYEVGLNTSGGLSNNFDFGLSLRLPRFEKKVKLKIQKVKEEWNALDNSGNVVSNVGLSSSISNKDKYDLMLQYRGHKGKRSSIGLTGGVRFNKIFWEPYVGIKAKYIIFQEEKQVLLLRNTLRFYISGEMRDTLYSKYVRRLGINSQFGWYNNLDYTSKSNKQDLKTEFVLQTSNNNYSFFRTGFIAWAKLKNFNNPRKENFEIYTKYHNKMRNKKWMYYEVTPAIEWKRKDNFKPSFTLKFKIGATFGGTRK